MSDAIRWASSDSPYDRRFAADVLSDIAMPEAIDYIKTLSHDSDQQVAKHALGVLSDLQRRHMQHPPWPNTDTPDVSEVPMSQFQANQANQ